MWVTNWNDIPPEIKKYIINIGKGLYLFEFTAHQRKFKECLFDIQYRTLRHLHIYLRFRVLTCTPIID